MLFYHAFSSFSLLLTYTFWFLQFLQQTFIPTVEFVIPTGISTNEANSEIKRDKRDKVTACT